MSETCGGLASNTKPFAEMVKYTKEEAIENKVIYQTYYAIFSGFKDFDLSSTR